MSLTQKLKSYYNTESGRSMIEMLGVLAIIGVLAIAGIAGYRFAVIKYKVTETINELNQRAIVYNQQLISGAAALNSDEFGTKTLSGYVATASLSSEYENEFEIVLRDIPTHVCQDILRNYTIPSFIYVGETQYTPNDKNTDICSKEKAVTLKFVYQIDLLSNDDHNAMTTQNSCAGIECGSHGSCQNGICQCTDNYYGNLCENAPLNCQNNGTWNTITHRCDCPLGYVGNTCETAGTIYICHNCHVSDIDGNHMGICPYTCKSEGNEVIGQKWLDACDRLAPNGYYYCRFAVVFNSAGEFIKECHYMCNGVQPTVEEACENDGTMVPVD